jgi:hypothetical protein
MDVRYQDQYWNLADSALKRVKIPESSLTLFSPGDVSCDSRVQQSASAIQSVRLAGSRYANSLHSAARDLSSD